MSQKVSDQKTTVPKRLKFTEEEDQILLTLYSYYPQQWSKIGKEMNRTSRQVLDRYKNYLDPTINRSPWTFEEDAILERKSSI